MKQVIRKITLLGCFCTVLITTALMARGGTLTFSNTNFITINEDANTNVNVETIASPYPSSLTVTGLTSQVTTKVTVTLKNFTHPFPSDVNILLVGPQGQMGILMSDVGGSSQQFSVTNLVITLDDGAPSTLPVNAAFTTGTFRPNTFNTNAPLDFSFQSPAPAGNSNAAVALSMFKNIDPSGTWNLFVVADSLGDQGSISGGWSLNVSFVPPQLAIAPVPPNYQLSWPATAQNYLLQSTSNLLDPNSWTVLTNATNVVLNRFVVSVPLSTNGNKFFRLMYH